MDIKDRVKLVREQLNLSYAEFGKLVGISKDKAFSIESGRQKVPSEILQRLVIKHGISASWLLTGRGFMNQSVQDEAANYKTGDKGWPVHRAAFTTGRFYSPEDNADIKPEPGELICHWIADFMDTKSEEEQAWLEVEMTRHFPEYKEWKKK